MRKLASKKLSGSPILDSITLSMHRRNAIGVYNPKSLILRRFMMITRKIEDKKLIKENLSIDPLLTLPKTLSFLPR